MKELFQIKDSTANRISYYLILFFLLSLPFDRFYSHLIMVCLFIHTLINLRKSDIKPLFTLQNIMLQSVFFVTLISSFYSIDKTHGYQEIGKQAFILLMPILFCLNPIDLKKYRNNFFLIFSIGCTLSVVYLYVQALVTINYYHLPLAALFSPAFINHNFSEPFGIHATFFSMQLSLALIYLLSVALKSSNIKSTIPLLLCCCVLTSGIIQLSSKSVFVSLLLIINFAIPYFILNSKKRIPYILITLIFNVLLFVGIYKIDALKTRYLTEFKSDLNSTISQNLIEPRLARWQVAKEVILTRPIFGHGAGSETELLRAGYFEKKLYRSYLASLNAHSEFLSLLIKAGIFGLLVYLITLIFGFTISIRNKDVLLFSFIVLVALVSFSENLLDVDKGIIFYSFFFSLLYFSSNLNQSKNHQISST
jgi:O-antigen ligase